MSGTSQNDINNKEGLATSYSSETMRYTVLLDNGRTVALKANNLIQVGDSDEPSGSSMPSIASISHLLNRLPPQIRMKLQRGEMPTMADLTCLLPPGVTLMHLGGAGVLVIFALLKFGIVKTVLLFGTVGFILYAGFGPFSRAGYGVAGLKAASIAVGETVSDLIGRKTRKYISPRISVAIVAALLAAVMYFVFFTGSRGAASSLHRPVETSFPNSYGRTFSESALTFADAYALGYSDAISGKVQDWQAHSDQFTATRQTFHSDFSDSHSYQPPEPQASVGLFGGFGIGKIISLLVLGKQIHGLGAQPGGGWDKDLALANLMNQSNVQKGMMLFMVLRLLGMSPI